MRTMTTMKTLILCWLAMALTVGAAELRIWTSVKGTTLEAKLQRYDAEKGLVYLAVLKPEPKELKLKLMDLSLADRQHLVEYADADPKILTEGDLEVPEEDARVNTGDFEKLKERMALDGGSDLVFNLMQTEHFLVATSGNVRPQGVGEMAERLWHGMAFHHMEFREDWGDGRMLIVLIAKDRIYKEVGEWYAKYLAGIGRDAQAQRVKMLWERLGSTTIYLPGEVAEKHEVFTDAVVFNVSDGGRYRKVFSPFPTHSLAGRIIAHQIGGTSEFGSRGYFAITTGHAYYKEIQLADKTETHLLDASEYDGNEIVEARGFEDGTSWAKTLRKMVRKGDVVPKLESLLALEDATNLTPQYQVHIYSLAYYMQSTPGRLSAYAKMIRRSGTSNQIPASIEIAKIFGFDSVEALEADWIEFIKSTKFK
jgi:hypothetical protein